MQISDHFWYSEFCKRDHHILTVLQMHMIQCLARDVLEPIRKFLCDQFSDEISMKIISGVRFPSDHNRLKKQGYNPSETSDHFFGNIVKLRDPVKIRKYGKYYQYSVGAVDTIPKCGAKEAWDRLRPHMSRTESSILLPGGNIRIGQMILEKRKNYWLHISNSPKAIYNDFVVDTFLKREPFLVSQDNGYTYEPIA